MDMADTDRNWRNVDFSLSFLLVLSLALKLALLAAGHVVNPDGVRYIDAARLITEGDFIAAVGREKMLLYPFLLATFNLLIRDWVLAGQIISLVSLVVTLFPLFWLTTGIFNQRVAFWAGFAFVLSPTLNGLSIDLIRDPLFLCFATWSIYYFWRSLTGSRIRFYGLTSLFAILALMCRIEGLGLFVLYPAICLVLAARHPSERSSLFKGTAVMAGIPLLLLFTTGGMLQGIAGVEIDFLNRWAEVWGRLQAIANGEFLFMYRYLYDHLGSLDNPHAYWSSGSFYETARHYLPIIYLFGLVEALFENLFLLFVVPLIVGFGKRPVFNRAHWLLLSVAGFYFLVAYYWLFIQDFTSKRYLLLPTLMLYPWVGRGLDRIWIRLSEVRRPRIAMLLFLFIFCGIPAFKTLGVVVGPDKSSIFKEAGIWLAEQNDLRGYLLAGNDPRFRLYSAPDLRFVEPAEEFSIFQDYNASERIALEREVDFLILEISQKRRDELPPFQHYTMLKELTDGKKVVLVFRRIVP
ncbi:MAG: glycosyltransferase family 39 protein [Syntrophotaleaceae bacterium]